MAQNNAVRRCTLDDLPFVNFVMAHESVYDDISDDGSSDRQDFTAKPLLENENVYVLAVDRYTIFVFTRMFHGVCQQHTCILPTGRGRTAVKSWKKARHWLIDNTDFFKIMGFYPEYNRKAGVFGALCGMKQEGRLTSAWQKNGEIFDLIMMGTEV